MTPNQRHIYLILQEALRKGQDKEFMAQVEQHRSEGLGWRYDGLADWSTPDIFAKLGALAVDADPARFREQAQAAGRPKALYERWRAGRNWGHSFWGDFPFLAAEELWRRLAPDLVCPEFIADRVGRVISTADDPVQGAGWSEREEMDAALQVIAYLEEVPPAERAARFAELADCTLCDLSVGLLDLVLHCGRKYPDEVTRLADIMADADPRNAANHQGDLAQALLDAGRVEAALERVSANLERFPDDVWVQIKAADVYAGVDRHEEALALYVGAMRTTRNRYDWLGAAERLPEVLQKLGREGEYESIVRAHPQPRERHFGFYDDEHDDDEIIDDGTGPDSAPPGSGWASPWDEASPSLIAGTKVGRNDPCPCGSGKKYKKCCLEKG